MTSSTDDILLKVYDQFENFTKKPEFFLSAQLHLSEEVKILVKQLYDLSQIDSESKHSLPELIVKGFDEEQIWQELELRNEEMIPLLIADVATLLSKKEKLKISLNSLCPDRRKVGNSEGKDPETGSENEKLSQEDDNLSSELSDSSHNSDGGFFEVTRTDEVNSEMNESHNVKSVVDDEFFKLDEMEKFLIKEEQNTCGSEGESDDEEIDYFDDQLEGTDEEMSLDLNPRYKDFFAPPKTEKRNENTKELDRNDSLKNVRFALQEMANGDDKTKLIGNEIEAKSKFEERQERLQKKIRHLENSNLAEKPWQLKGEISASARPPNSLLEEVLEVDISTRPAPIITEKTTLKLEDVIKQRIKDKAWDDVEKKFKPVDTPNEFKKKLVLDQEKSKMSLAEIYEQEYLKKKKELDQNNDDKEEESEEHKEIKKMMKSLFLKLDALSNFHYTPKPPVPELQVVSHVPAIEMEEVAPVATSEAKLLAPEEVKAKPKGDVIGKGERSDTDKNRERRQKKQRQRERRIARERREKLVNKLKPGLGNKYSKEKAIKMLEKVTREKNVDLLEEGNKKVVKSSKAFFAQLQDEVTSHIKSRIGGGTKKDKKSITAVKVKL